MKVVVSRWATSRCQSDMNREQGIDVPVCTIWALAALPRASGQNRQLRSKDSSEHGLLWVPRRVVWLWLEEELGGGEGVTEEVFSEQVSLETKGCYCWGKDKSIQRCENLWHCGDTSNTTCGKTLPLFYGVMWWRVTVCVCVCGTGRERWWWRNGQCRGGRKWSCKES